MPTATIHLPSSIYMVEALLEGLVVANQYQIASGIVPPSPLYAGVKYMREGSGLEEWRTADRVLKLGSGDCEDLNSWAVAGLRETGEDPGAKMVLYRSGPRLFHAVGMKSNGSIYDVCPALGMRTPSNHKLPGR